MIVSELIAKLSDMPPDAEIGYHTHKDGIDLLVGEDEKYGEIITIKQPEWA